MKKGRVGGGGKGGTGVVKREGRSKWRGRGVSKLRRGRGVVLSLHHPNTLNR